MHAMMGWLPLSRSSNILYAWLLGLPELQTNGVPCFQGNLSVARLEQIRS